MPMTWGFVVDGKEVDIWQTLSSKKDVTDVVTGDRDSKSKCIMGCGV